MSLINRPTKPIGGGGGSSWIANAELHEDELNEDIDTIYTDYNGNITNANISENAAIEGSKLASAPNGVSRDKINAKAVGSAELSSDATTDANRAVGQDHIKDSAILFRHLKLTTYSYASPLSLTAGALASINTGVPFATNQALLAWCDFGGGLIQVAVTVVKDVSTWRLLVRNLSGATYNFSADTFKLLYLSYS